MYGRVDMCIYPIFPYMPSMTLDVEMCMGRPWAPGGGWLGAITPMLGWQLRLFRPSYDALRSVIPMIIYVE